MKKLFILALIIFTLCTITGCGENDIETKLRKSVVVV